MVIVIFSAFNPWGKLVMTIGVLQLMIQVPSFLARAQISPMSDFIAAGVVSGGLLKGAAALGDAAKLRTGQAFDYLMNQRYDSRGLRKSERVELGNTPTGVADPELLAGLRASGAGKPNGDKPPGKALEHKGGPQKPEAGALKKPGDKTGVTPPRLGPDGKPIKTPGAADAAAARKAGSLAPGTGAGSGAPGTPPSSNPSNPLTTPGSAAKTAAGVMGTAALGGALAAAIGAKAGVDDTAKSEAAKRQEQAEENARAMSMQQARGQARRAGEERGGQNKRCRQRCQQEARLQGQSSGKGQAGCTCAANQQECRS